MSGASRGFFSRLRAIFSKARLDDEFNEELAAHVDLLASENEKAGMTSQEARRAALVRVGGRELTREIHRETRGLPFLEVFLQDFRYALRTLRRDAGFFIAAVCIVGLGIGASTTIFSVVNALLLRPLPFQDPARLVWIANDDGGTGGLSAQTVQVDPFLELPSQNQSFSDTPPYFPFSQLTHTKFTRPLQP